jgi:hypothetical protein
MMTSRRGVALAATIVSCALSAIADHLPAEKQARGKPEHVLAGVNVYRGKVADAVRRFGNGRVENHSDSDYPAGSGERTYRWQINGVRLQLATVFRTDWKTRRLIEGPPQVVDVWGDSPADRATSTGAGLSLGGTLADVIRLHGRQFERGENWVIVQWRDETTLVVDFNGSGRITHMHLEASID